MRNPFRRSAIERQAQQIEHLEHALEDMSRTLSQYSLAIEPARMAVFCHFARD